MMRAVIVLLAAAGIQFLALVLAAMFVDARWPRNVYPYVRYPQWIDGAMFAGGALLLLTLAAAVAVLAVIMSRENR